MKKLICIMVLSIGFIGTVAAQTSIEETKKVTQDEVPVAVLKAYETNFGALTDGAGYWTLVYTQSNKDVYGTLTEKEIFTPIAYIYKIRDTKSEARFSVSGKLESSKGLTTHVIHTEK